MDKNPPVTREAFLDEGSRLEDIYPHVYDELRRLAQYYMRLERTDHTLQPTALVHEAYLRLVKQDNDEFASRTQFIAVAAKMMRRILVNHAVHRNRQKREGSYVRVTLDRAIDVFNDAELNLLDLDAALRRLTKLDEMQGRIFELRFFGGLSVEETAEVVGRSVATVKREWSTAKLFLQRELRSDK
ncbi:MAG: ECF-type sigma factor [Pyrinomonadaceae bacterium]